MVRLFIKKIIFKILCQVQWQKKKKAVDGQDIYTTLDSRLQSYLETLMDQVNEGIISQKN